MWYIVVCGVYEKPESACFYGALEKQNSILCSEKTAQFSCWKHGKAYKLAVSLSLSLGILTRKSYNISTNEWANERGVKITF